MATLAEFRSASQPTAAWRGPAAAPTRAGYEQGSVSSADGVQPWPQRESEGHDLVMYYGVVRSKHDRLQIVWCRAKKRSALHATKPRDESDVP